MVARHTSCGFLDKNVELIFVKCAAIAICVFISSGGRSSTVSQNGTRSSSARATHVSTMLQISLHSTSVATYGYLHPPHNTNTKHTAKQGEGAREPQKGRRGRGGGGALT